MKKFVSIILAMLIMSCGLSLTAFADEATGISSFSVGVRSDKEHGAQVEAEWFEKSGKYYLAVPDSIDLNESYIYFDSSADIYLGEAKLENGMSSAVIADKTEFVLTCAGDDYSVTVLAESGVSSVFIDTESGTLDSVHADKEHKEKGEITIINSDGGIECDDELEYIKGRGNSTWGMAKKPYNIKLESKKDLFGMGKSKKWSLIANYQDSSGIRNALSYSAAQAAGLAYTPEYEPVDLYVNGEYQGAYLLTTRVEVDKTRVNIDDLEKANEEANPDIEDFASCARGGVYGTFSGYIEGSKKWIEMDNDPAEISGGYLLEHELPARYCDEISGFVTNGSQAVVIKSPEYASKAQVEYISGYYQNFEDIIRNENSTQADVAKYCNVDSLIKVYLFNEWVANHDAGLTSSYFYKPVGDTLYAGPVWDFDASFGNSGAIRFGIDYSNPKTWTAAYSRLYAITYIGAGNTTNNSPTYLKSLAGKQWFAELAKQSWDSSLKAAFESATDYIKTDYADRIEGSAVANAIRWGYFGTTDIEEIKAAFRASVSKVTVFAEEKAEFITDNIGTVPEPWSEKTFIDKITDSFNIVLNELFEKFIVLFGLINVI